MGGPEAQKKRFVCLKSTSNFGPFDKVHFFPEDEFSDVGGWVGQVEELRLPSPPPPPQTLTLSRGLPCSRFIVTLCHPSAPRPSVKCRLRCNRWQPRSVSSLSPNPYRCQAGLG